VCRCSMRMAIEFEVSADDVEEVPRGMMWRVYSFKTKKTRKIPVRPAVAELTRELIKTAPRGSGLTEYSCFLAKENLHRADVPGREMHAGLGGWDARHSFARVCTASPAFQPCSRWRSFAQTSTTREPLEKARNFCPPSGDPCEPKSARGSAQTVTPPSIEPACEADVPRDLCIGERAARLHASIQR
jgi:hypothetical protein